MKGLMEANDTTAKEEDDDADTMGALEPETEIMESGEEEEQERDGAVVVQGHDWGEEEYSYSGKAPLVNYDTVQSPHPPYDTQ